MLNANCAQVVNVHENINIYIYSKVLVLKYPLPFLHTSNRGHKLIAIFNEILKRDRRNGRTMNMTNEQAKLLANFSKCKYY